VNISKTVADTAIVISD